MPRIEIGVPFSEKDDDLPQERFAGCALRETHQAKETNT
jgi:hypothetical protein